MHEPLRTRVIGILGGLSWEASALYYRLMNEAVQAALGGHHNARSVVYTVDFEQMLTLAEERRWDEVGRELSAASRRLEAAGAECIVMASNTAHLVFAEVAAAVRVPVLHIADALGRALRRHGARRVGLLATRYVLDSSLYQEWLTYRHDVEVVMPLPAECDAVHRIIVDELTAGTANAESRRQCVSIIEGLARRGSDGVVLACTELPLLLSQGDTALPLFDTTRLHVDDAVSFALGVGT
jgi:aspartate racemase